MTEMLRSFTKGDVSSRAIFLWGGTVYGEMAYEVIRNMYGADIKGVIDNKYSQTPWYDKPCIKSSDLSREEYRSIDLIICAANAFQLICREAKKLEQNDVRIFDMRIILEDYKLLLEQSSDTGIKSSYLYGDIDLNEIVQRYNYYVGCDNGYQNKVYLPYCVLCITSRCSLKCKDCAAFVTDYKKQEDYSLEYIKDNFSKVLDAIDGIDELEVMGGEPFLHRNLDEILEWCIAQKKIHAVKIVSNGTIVPTKKIWNIMKHNKIKLVIDDYGELSRYYDEILKLAKRYGVRYEAMKLQTWYQLKPIVKKNLPSDRLNSIYKNCNFKTCIGMTNGRFYHCNVAGHMNACGLISDQDSDYVQVVGGGVNASELREKIRKLLNIDCLKACDYCNYCAHIEIPVAEQMQCDRK